MKAIQRLTLVFVILYAFCGLVTNVRDSPGGGYIFIYILCTLEHVGAKSEVWCTINRFKLPSGLVPLTVQGGTPSCSFAVRPLRFSVCLCTVLPVVFNVCPPLFSGLCVVFFCLVCCCCVGFVA